MAIGASEAETFWTEFLRSLTRRGLRGVQLVISDDHKGLKVATTRILGATWQRCRVHFMRNLLAHAGKQGQRVVSAVGATAFAQDDAEAAAAQRMPRKARRSYTTLGTRSLTNCWRTACADAKLGVLRLHDLRHTAASKAVMSGENLPLVRKLLGHRQHRTTARYAHFADEHLVESAENV